MRKFKVGDTVVCTSGHFSYCNGPVYGKRYEVLSVGRGSLHYTIGIKLPKCTYELEIKNGTRPNWGETIFELIGITNQLKEVDYLDAFQNNFRDGV